MANKGLIAAANGGLQMDISADPDTLEIDPTNLTARTDMNAAGLSVLIDDNNTPKIIAIANFLGELLHDTVIGTASGNAEIILDDNNSNVEVSNGTLLAVNNYAVSVGGTNADCYIDNVGLIAPNTSSREVKEHIEDAGDPDVDRLLALRPRKYNRKGQTEEEIGLVAEEVAEVWPEIVSWKSVEIEPKILPSGRKKRRFVRTDQPQGVNYSRLVAPLLRMAQTQAAQIAAMQVRLDALEAR